MSRVGFRRVARLEKRALPYIERKRRSAQEERARSASRLENCFVKIANLAVLILYGDPKIGEPLSCAWRRCLETETWKACREGHPDIDKEALFDEQGAQSIAQYFREYILPDLPGAEETEKLNAVLAKAPAWLLWFTNAELSVMCLGLKLPDLSSMSRFARPEDCTDDLPDGAFELRRLPDGVEDQTLCLFLELERKELALEAKLTPRERLRALRSKESAAMSESDSPQSPIDKRPAGEAVAALLRRMSQDSAFVDASATNTGVAAILVDE
jgi:hypothetical protein